ncbi:histidine-type phosphatase [Flammeovirga agarivorans]|uniref:Multiple inositol polyphosphate phosphatase 1 n=1 Tax=Flammeovirga agarivorans TaxID=2726742 RepID=A0A7X8SJX8_9BACT|nr:histidine-type phosphatase [Flammeovirga agarivorans]NLR91512.1 histidine phosphatase family protein [Flammeovirga agarivorans]
MNRQITVLILSTFQFFFMTSCSQENTKQSLTTEQEWNIGSKKNYMPPKEITPIPEDYETIFITNVARHGSRYMSGPGEDIALYELMMDADKQNQLTEEGKLLMQEVKQLIDLQKNNYGQLTPLGKEEHFAIGQRLYDIAPDFFKSSTKFIGNATYKSRTQNSRGAFIQGLKEKDVHPEWEINNFIKGKDPLLRYHKISPNYKAYKDSAIWEEQIVELKKSKEYLDIVDAILPNYFKSQIINNIENGEKVYKDDEGEVVIASKMDIILALYECFKISFAITPDQRPDFLVFTPSETQLLAKIGDVEAFYEKGPGYKGRKTSYANSTTLLMNISNNLRLASKGTLDYQGYFNFAHAETTLPLAVLLDLNNINRKSDHVLNIEWSEGEYASMASNIEWFLLEKEGEKFVQVRFNEQPATLPLEGNQDNVYLLDSYLDYVETLITPNQISDTNYMKTINQF